MQTRSLCETTNPTIKEGAPIRLNNCLRLAGPSIRLYPMQNNSFLSTYVFAQATRFLMISNISPGPQLVRTDSFSRTSHATSLNYLYVKAVRNAISSIVLF